MPRNYINTGFAPGSSDYTDTSDLVHIGTVAFSARNTSVKVGTATQRMSNGTITVVNPFGVTSCDDQCEVGQLNETIKVQINVKYGDNAAITSMRAQINSLLDIWQAKNLAFGVVPPVDTDINGA